MEKTAREIATGLRESGHIAYFAGGCVRDIVRGQAPKDFDIATDAKPEIVQKRFPRTYAVGAHFGVIIVRLEPGKTKEALASLKTVCHEINPNYPFAFQFLDQEYDKLYRNEQIITKLTTVFAVLGVAISCLGLLGLVMLAAEQRTKEIGIRKVLGATVTNIVNLLSKEFLALVLVSFLIAAPMAGYFMDQWLQGFAYKIELSWWIFVIAGVTALTIALLTISIQALQSAIRNPVKALRTE